MLLLSPLAGSRKVAPFGTGSPFRRRALRRLSSMGIAQHKSQPRQQGVLHIGHLELRHARMEFLATQVLDEMSKPPAVMVWEPCHCCCSRLAALVQRRCPWSMWKEGSTRPQHMVTLSTSTIVPCTACQCCMNLSCAQQSKAAPRCLHVRGHHQLYLKQVLKVKSQTDMTYTHLTHGCSLTAHVVDYSVLFLKT